MLDGQRSILQPAAWFELLMLDGQRSFSQAELAAQHGSLPAGRPQALE